MHWYWWVVLIQGLFILMGGILGWRLADFDPLMFIIGPKKATTRDRLRGFVVGCALVGAILLLADGLIVASPYAREAYSWSMKRLGLQVTQLLIGAAALLAGWGAYEFKGWNRYAYGVVEVIFAGAVAIACGRQMARNPDWSGPLAGLGGAIYVVSRGLGNCEDARTEARKAQAAAQASRAPTAPTTAPVAPA